MFRESVRHKLQEQTQSFTKLFILLDEDRDGRISPSDVARYLQRCSISHAGLEKEIEGWFAEQTDQPAHGLDCAQFARFLQTAAPLPNQQPLSLSKRDIFEDHLNEEQLTRLREHFVKHMARLGCNRNQYYNALTGGRGLLYEQRLREVIEAGEQRCLQEDEWRNIYWRIKTNGFVNSITREELFAFIFNEKPVNKEEQIQAEFTRGELEPPQDLREPYGENTPEFMSFSRHVPKTRGEVPADEPRPKSPNLLRLKSAPSGQSATRFEGSPEALYALLSDKIQTAGQPRQVFVRMDAQKSGSVSYRVFAQQLRLVFGIDLEPEQIKGVLSFMFPEKQVDFINYEAFLAFYEQGRVLNGINKSAAAQNERKQLQVVRTEPGDGLSSSRQQSVKNEESPQFIECTKSPGPAKLGGTGVMAAEVPERYTSTMQLSFMPQKALERIVVTDAQSEQTKEAAQTVANFKSHVKRMLDNRHINMSVLIRECFPGKRTLSSRELLWLFRNKVGVSYSIKTITDSIGATEGFVRADDLIKLFD